MLSSGKLPQTGIGIYGYKWLKDDKKWIPLEHEAKIIQRMFEMVPFLIRFVFFDVLPI